MLKVDVEKRDNNVITVKPKGRLDTETYMEFEKSIEPLLGKKPKAFVLDLSGLEYISSAGLGVIFGAKKIIESNKGSFLMTNLKPQIKKVFDIVKAMPTSSVFTSMQEVDNYLDAMQKKEMGSE